MLLAITVMVSVITAQYGGIVGCSFYQTAMTLIILGKDDSIARHISVLKPDYHWILWCSEFPHLNSLGLYQI